MIAAIPWLALRARQLGAGPSTLQRGVSLGYALFIEAAGRDAETLAAVHRALYFMTDEAWFWQQVDEVRAARRLAPLDRPPF